MSLFLLIRPLLPDTEKLFDIGVRAALTILLAWLAQRALFMVIGRAERVIARSEHGSPHAAQRARTLGQILRNLITVMLTSAAGLHILSLFGWDVRPLLAGAGIIGVALGFGAQTLVRDVIAGVFILAEDQFGVGDLIEVNGKAATVEAVNVRATTLRDFNGYVHFVPNGEMKIIINRSRGWNRIAVDVSVWIGQNLDAALEACRRAVEELNRDPRWHDRLLDPIELWGVESVTAVDAVIRMVVRARPGSDGPETARELRRRALLALAQAGIRAQTHPAGLDPATGRPPEPAFKTEET